MVSITNQLNVLLSHIVVKSLEFEVVSAVHELDTFRFSRYSLKYRCSIVSIGELTKNPDTAKIFQRFLMFIMKTEKHMIAIWRTSSAKLQ